MTALVINSIIGNSIFGLPSELTRLLGRASPVAMLVAALIVSLIVACMAEVASQFTEAGGSYLYVRKAFGRFAGLQVGWFGLFACMAGGAANATLFVLYLASMWPAAGERWERIGIMAAVIIVPTAVNYFGVRRGANLSTVLTVAKLLPLILLIVLGLVHFGNHPQLISVAEFAQPRMSAWMRALLLLIFAYAGFEFAVAPAGEVKDPRRTVPFALATGLAICAALYTMIQFVTVATIGASATAHPLAETASVLLHRGGSLFVAVSVMISTYAWISGNIVTAPRIVYSFASNGDLPDWLAKINPTFNTPAWAIIIYAVLMWLLAATGTYLWVAAVGAAALLILYSGVCASLIRLRRLHPEAQALRIPFGPALAVVSIAVSLALISALNLRQGLLIGVTALIASANWWWAKRQTINEGVSTVAVAASRR
jgi:amino acid transporter